MNDRKSSKKTTVLKRNRIISVLFILMCFPAFSQEQKNPKHEVSVTRMIIPVFAYDSNSNPVYDLKKEDISVYIDGKKAEVGYFNRIVFEYEWEKTGKPAGKNERAMMPERTVFIVIDTMFSSFYGIRKSKDLARKLTEGSTLPGQFVIFENSIYGGLILRGGPEKDKQKLKKFIKKISPLPERVNPVGGNDASEVDDYSPVSGTEVERKIDKERVKYFCDFLSRLKYTLQGFAKPKMVILLSEGIPEILNYEANPYVQDAINFDPTVIRNISRMVKEINAGGTSLYTIYTGRVSISKNKPYTSSEPQKGEAASEDNFSLDDSDIAINKDSGIESLKTMAMASGGRFFDDTGENVVNEIHNTTSAYYELAVSPSSSSSPNQEMHIDLKCNREGIRVETPRMIKSNPGYIDMDKMQKKVLALNIAMGRNWAQDISKVERVGFNRIGTEKIQIEVYIPAQMNGRKVDIFIIRWDEGFGNAKIYMDSRVAANIENIDIKEITDKKEVYFVIIEPVSNTCIFNKI